MYVFFFSIIRENCRVSRSRAVIIAKDASSYNGFSISVFACVYEREKSRCNMCDPDCRSLFEKIKEDEGSVIMLHLYTYRYT